MHQRTHDPWAHSHFLKNAARGWILRGTGCPDAPYAETCESKIHDALCGFGRNSAPPSVLAEDVAQGGTMRPEREIDDTEKLHRFALLYDEGEHSFASIPIRAPTGNERRDRGDRLVWPKAHPANGDRIGSVTMKDCIRIRGAGESEVQARRTKRSLAELRSERVRSISCRHEQFAPR